MIYNSIAFKTRRFSYDLEEPEEQCLAFFQVDKLNIASTLESLQYKINMVL